MKEHNLLIGKDEIVKFGDFGVSFLVDKDDTSNYFLKGLAPGYCLKETE